MSEHDGTSPAEAEFLRVWTEAFGVREGSRPERVDRIDAYRLRLDELWSRLTPEARRRRRHELEGLERLRQAIVAGMGPDELTTWGGNPRLHRPAQAYVQYPDGSFAIETTDGMYTWREHPDGTFTETDPQGRVTVLSLADDDEAADTGDPAAGAAADDEDELDDRD